MIAPTPPGGQGNADAALCKSTPNKVSNLYSEMNSCRNEIENGRIDSLMFKIMNTKQDMEQEATVFNDLILSGDNIFGTTTHDSNMAEIQKRNQELKDMKENLQMEIDKNESTAERADRDFVDSREALPDSLPNKTLHVIEDYTLATALFTYIFMALAFLYVYVVASGYTVKSILIGLVAEFVISIILFSILYKFI
jgi:Fe2+ transport system protein B